MILTSGHFHADGQRTAQPRGLGFGIPEDKVVYPDTATTWRHIGCRPEVDPSQSHLDWSPGPALACQHSSASPIGPTQTTREQPT